jgi:hypothetical protein
LDLKKKWNPSTPTIKFNKNSTHSTHTTTTQTKQQKERNATCGTTRRAQRKLTSAYTRSLYFIHSLFLSFSLFISRFLSQDVRGASTRVHMLQFMEINAAMMS